MQYLPETASILDFHNFEHLKSEASYKTTVKLFEEQGATPSNLKILEMEVSDDLAYVWWPAKLLGAPVSASIFNLGDWSSLKKIDWNRRVPKNATQAVEFLYFRLNHKLHYDAVTDTWYAWNGVIHAPLKSDAVPLQVIDFLGKAYEYLDYWLGEYVEMHSGFLKNSGAASAKQDVADFKAEMKALTSEWKQYYSGLQSNRGVRDTLDKLKRYVSITPDHFEDDRRWLVVRNGVIDLEAYRATGKVELLPHEASRPVTRFFDADYDPAAPVDVWSGFLASSIVDDGGDTVKLLQKAVGAAYSAEEKPRALFNLLGAPASGKSVFLSVFNKLGQDYSVMPNNQAIQLNNGDTNFYQDALRGKRFVGFSEVQGKKPLDDGFIKGIMGGDEQTTRKMRQMEVAWKPQCVMFIASNMALKFNTRDEATFVKILPIPFPHSFTLTDPEHLMDRDLEKKILEQRSGVLNWVLWGMQGFWKEGLEPTAAVLEAMDGNKTANSSALQFMAAMLEAGHLTQDNMAPLSGCITVGTAYDMFRIWADAQGIRNIPGKQTFSGDVADFYHGKERSNGARFVGLFMNPHFVQNVQSGVGHLSLAKNL